MFRTREPQESLWQSEFLITPRKCQGRRDIRPRGGAKVYHSGLDVQRKCPPATGVVRSRQWQRGRWSLCVRGIAG